MGTESFSSLLSRLIVLYKLSKSRLHTENGLAGCVECWPKQSGQVVASPNRQTVGHGPAAGVGVGVSLAVRARAVSVRCDGVL